MCTIVWVHGKSRNGGNPYRFCSSPDGAKEKTIFIVEAEAEGLGTTGPSMSIDTPSLF
jgi:hypothetical protein